MDPIIQDKINGWLTDGYDQATRDEIPDYKRKVRTSLPKAFIKILNLEQAGYAASWAFVPTGSINIPSAWLRRGLPIT